jgi:hypothetical protein
MKSLREHGILWLLSLMLLGMLLGLQVYLKPWQESEKKLEQMRYLPNGEYLRIASLGYRELLADMLWIQAIQVMGEKKLSDSSGQWLYRALDSITTIDPHFVRAYEAGGLALTTLVVLPEESNRLLKKGMQNNPAEWKLPFLLGINYYYELYDDATAADYMVQASRVNGAPAMLGTLAANLFVSAHSPQQAADILGAMYRNTTDESAKQLLEVRLRLVLTERDLQLLEHVIVQYQKQIGRLPASLDDLVRSHLLTTLPEEPSGGRYVYDARTGAVSSSTMAERLTLTGRRRGR